MSSSRAKILRSPGTEKWLACQPRLPRMNWPSTSCGLLDVNLHAGGSACHFGFPCPSVSWPQRRSKRYSSMTTADATAGHSSSKIGALRGPRQSSCHIGPPLPTHVRRQRDGEVHHRTNRHFPNPRGRARRWPRYFRSRQRWSPISISPKIGSLMGKSGPRSACRDSARGWLSSMQVSRFTAAGGHRRRVFFPNSCAGTGIPVLRKSPHCSTLRGADYTPEPADKSYGSHGTSRGKALRSWN